MTGLSTATCPGVPPKQLWPAFEDGLRHALPRFANLALISSGSSGTTTVWLANPNNGSPVAQAEFSQNKNGCPIWQSQPDLIFFWFQETVAAIACRHAESTLGRPVLLSAEGKSAKPRRPDFDLRHPRLRDWEAAKASSGRGLRGVTSVLDRLSRNKDHLRDVHAALERLPFVTAGNVYSGS